MGDHIIMNRGVIEVLTLPPLLSIIMPSYAAPEPSQC